MTEISKWACRSVGGLEGKPKPAASENDGRDLYLYGIKDRAGKRQVTPFVSKEYVISTTYASSLTDGQRASEPTVVFGCIVEKMLPLLAS